MFNAALRQREAIVANEPGTTRDSLWGKIDYNNQNFWLIDTAGLKKAADDFEFTIQEQIVQAVESADVILVTIEADVPFSEEDRRVAKLALKSQKPVMLIVNKHDRARKTTENDFRGLGIKEIALTSATQKSGISDVLDNIIHLIPRVDARQPEVTMSISLIGRPNVGKSSLFNALGKKQQAIVADRAGTTRDINRLRITYNKQPIELLDTAGIRRSGKIERGIEKFSVIRSLKAIEESDICLLLIDANDLTVSLDQKLAGAIKEAGKGLVLVVSKWDDIEDKTPFTRDQMAAQIKQIYDFVPWASLIFVSSVTGQNVTKILEVCEQIYDKRKTKIKTSALNSWLKKITENHRPAGLKNRLPKLNYIVQESQGPINFQIYGAHTKFLHWSYKRYMEKELRREFGFEGTAIRLWFFDKRETHKHGVSPTREGNR